MTVAMIILDSLRYDVAEAAQTPNLAALGRWRRCLAPATYTLPSHLSMLLGGICPENRDGEPLYDRSKGAIFGYRDWGRDGHWRMDRDSTSIPDGFARRGYDTICVGGVGWFDTRRPTTRIWRSLFREYDWDPDYHENVPASFEHQIDFLRAVDKCHCFLLLNVASTHWPYRCARSRRALEEQIAALEYVDAQLPALLEMLPGDASILIGADHGECFGEDGLVGHGFVHEKVLEVPWLVCL